MRAALLVLAACGTATPPPAPPPPPPPPPAPVVVTPDAAPEPPPEPPPPRVTMYARQIVMSPAGYRRTYALTRAGAHVELVVDTHEWRDHRRQTHLDGTEYNEALWMGPQRETYAGAVHDIDGTTRLELSLISRTAFRGIYLELPKQLSWICRDVSLDVHAISAQPRRINPISTIQTGCSGSPVTWKPAGVQPITAWSCTPNTVMGRVNDLPFTAQRTVEVVAEWNDCHIQEVVFREAPPIHID